MWEEMAGDHALGRPTRARRCVMNVNDQPAAGTDLINCVVLAFDTQWRSDSHRDMYHRIIRELEYDLADVFEMRITETSIEVDYVDFENPAWPLMTKRHRAANGARSFDRVGSG
jgi:hypothetical protein